ncbi:hypothetical protein [Methylobacterium nodulans]|uniref:hypothetical protein n=1 Tax=Methylobacterium nodulans TaxID=114616 RepID=UPI0012ED4B16|nr:hypothetical protein [Methylobacterium nodulans]
MTSVDQRAVDAFDGRQHLRENFHIREVEVSRSGDPSGEHEAAFRELLPSAAEGIDFSRRYQLASAIQFALALRPLVPSRSLLLLNASVLLRFGLCRHPSSELIHDRDQQRWHVLPVLVEKQPCGDQGANVCIRNRSVRHVSAQHALGQEVREARHLGDASRLVRSAGCR